MLTEEEDKRAERQIGGCALGCLLVIGIPLLACFVSFIMNFGK